MASQNWDRLGLNKREQKAVAAVAAAVAAAAATAATAAAAATSFCGKFLNSVCQQPGTYYYYILVRIYEVVRDQLRMWLIGSRYTGMKFKKLRSKELLLLFKSVLLLVHYED